LILCGIFDYALVEHYSVQVINSKTKSLSHWKSQFWQKPRFSVFDSCRLNTIHLW